MAVDPLTPPLSADLRKMLDGEDFLGGGVLGQFTIDAELGSRIQQLSKMTGGTAVVLNGNTSVDVDVGADFDGGVVQLTKAEAKGSETDLFATWDGNGTLTIDVAADPGKDLSIYWSVDARSASDVEG